MAKCGCSGSVCNCVVQAGPGATVTGGGTPANPYIVGASSEDTIVQVADTPTVNSTITGDGSPGTPYIVSSAVIVDPVAGNTLVAGPAGLSVPCEAIQDCVGAGMDDGLIYDDALNQYRVRLSTDGGNVLTFGGDNGVYAPASPVDIGCGLTNGPGGEIITDTLAFSTLTRRNCGDTVDAPGTVPLAPGCELEGQAVYCDSAGNLRTKPEKFTEVEAAAINEAFAVAVLPFTTPAIQISVTNPSGCYCMCGWLIFSIIPAISGAAGTLVQIAHEIDLGLGGGFVPVSAYVMDNRGKTATSSAGNHRMAVQLNQCLDPGETKVFQHRVVFTRLVGDNGGAVSITAVARDIRYVGTNV